MPLYLMKISLEHERWVVLSSNRWTQRQRNDPYVKRAHEEGWRARSAFKLMELDDNEHFLRSAKVIVDLGAAPGGWAQVARARAHPSCQVFALDILPMEAIDGVVFLQGDFREAEVLEAFESMLRKADEKTRVDVVLSDMAPNISGIGPADQAKSMYLAELALSFAKDWLNPRGVYVVKVFQGAGFDEFLTEVRRSFQSVKVKKPKSSRAESREVYIVAKGIKDSG